MLDFLPLIGSIAANREWYNFTIKLLVKALSDELTFAIKKKKKRLPIICDLTERFSDFGPMRSAFTAKYTVRIFFFLPSYKLK